MTTDKEHKQNYNQEFTNLTIGYMINPDKVYYNEMDDVIIKHFLERGAKVEPFNIDEIHFSISNTNGIEVFIKNLKVNWDGFLSYGYMSKFHFEAYMYIVSSLEKANILTLHTAEHERILNNKLEQYLRFCKAGLGIPDSHMGFSILTYKWIAQDNFKGASVYKKLDDYGGEGVFKADTPESLVSSAAKILWKNEYCIFQKFVPDSLGKSVRVLCLKGKAVAVAEYNDKTNNFRSNYSLTDEYYSLDSLMESEKYLEYAKLSELAIQSIGNVLIGGVDILDSQAMGMVVLEVNGWPDIFDIARSTKIDVFALFANSFLENCALHKNKTTN